MCRPIYDKILYTFGPDLNQYCTYPYMKVFTPPYEALHLRIYRYAVSMTSGDLLNLT